MFRSAILIAIVLPAFTLGGCAGGPPSPLPTGPAAYTALRGTGDVVGDDIIRTGDHLSIRVLGEPELTSDAYIVDGKGAIQVPLAGEVIVAGRTSSEVRDDLTQRLGSRFVRDPQVTVGVAQRTRQTFAVEGDVREPGIFEAAPGTTLLSAIAQARSPNDTAKLSEVMVFRMQGGQRLGARFSLDDIRKGRAADPMILAGDTIVVARSGTKDAFKQFLQAVPVLNLFYVLK